ncbi:hypothetical protein GC169_01955 [bacterium]|nr:hypothetical protein [bacterium]
MAAGDHGAAASGGLWRAISAPFTHRGLAGFALAGFFALSVAATGLGFADLRAANTESERLAPGEIALIAATTLFVVSAMVVALHNAFFAARWWIRPISFVVYLFFAVWSVGFGYGFFWKEFAGQEFTERQFETTISGVATALSRTSDALEAVRQSASGAADLAAERAAIEARSGRTCANRPYSTPGDGPLTRSRFAVAERVALIRDDVESRWIAPLAVDRARLEARVSALVTGRTPSGAIETDERVLLEELAGAALLSRAERRELFAAVHADAEAFAERANSMRAATAPGVVARLRAVAADIGPDPDNPGSADPAREAEEGYCWDVVLGETLTSAAAQIDAIIDLTPPPFEFIEGPKATREAFFGLLRWLSSPFQPARGPDGGADDRAPTAVQPAFGEREFLALFASIAIDLGILFLTVVRDVRDPAAPSRHGPLPAPTPPKLESILPARVNRQRKRRSVGERL